MRGYAASNIAWPFEMRLAAYQVLIDLGITGLEIAPGMLFADVPDAFAPPDWLLKERVQEVSRAGLSLVSMQSLLFGVRDVQLFGAPEQRTNYATALKRAVRLASSLSIPHLVLGSPKERVIPVGMAPDEVLRIASDTLGDIADYAVAQGCRIGLEPNPEVYGTNCATNTKSAGEIVRQINHPGVILTLDVGSLLVNGELPNIVPITTAYADLIGHVHVSEPQLAPAPNDPATAARVIAALSATGYGGWVSLEMRASGDTSIEVLRMALGRLGTAIHQAF